MKINFGKALLDIKGEQIKDGDSVVTLGTVSAQALLGVYPDEGSVSAKDKVARFTLAAAVVNEQEVNLETEDVALVKAMIAKAYGPLIVGRAFEIIEGSAGS